VVVQYDRAGTALWAKVATYGGRVTATGGISGMYTHNAVVVEYR
jgi:hypothetical protein